MKYKYIVASALSLAVVGASIISPFSYSYDISDIPTPEYIIDNYLTSSYWTGLDVNMKTLSGTFGFVRCLKYDNNYQLTGFRDYLINHEPGRSYFNVTWYEQSSDGGYASGCNYGQPQYYKTSQIDNSWFAWGISGDSFRAYAPKTAMIQLGEHVEYYLSMSNVDEYFYNQSPYKPVNPELRTGSFNGSYGGVINSLIENIPAPVPEVTTNAPYTDSAPGFPNLPNVWVNGDGNTYNIDLPDFDFNLDLPSYTMPEAVSIPADIVQKSSALYQIPLNVIDRYGLWWLVGLALICTVITLILNR